MKSQMLKTFLYFFFFSFSNCYYNPIVNSLLNPPETEGNNSALALLGLPGPSLWITGQIRYANGVAEVGLVLQPGKSFAPQTKSTTGYVTDEGGRFYIPYQTGSIPFTVYKNGSYLFEFSLIVDSPTSISTSTYGAAPTLEITGLGTTITNSPSNFFELVGVYYLDGEMNEVVIDRTNHYTTVGSLILKFNANPASVETNDISWIQSAIIITPSPSVGYQALGIAGNRITFIGAEGFSMNTEYLIDVTNHIKSESGIALTPRRIRFCYEPSTPCIF
ncbi:hypothetical protein [Leptospira jelokensis]|uniref:SbsA Ig-like domain-containing protein n=1 Tax=Leptospira jelokensis TaxID=2484931 RepID=A0A4Z0ZMR7_9LEPT|nr:hypothetical protein [Leptospira jelokensis]TGL56839.1 hypothetical protein EHQ62_17960 [Leptospira jelokensis]